MREGGVAQRKPRRIVAGFPPPYTAASVPARAPSGEVGCVRRRPGYEVTPRADEQLEWRTSTERSSG